MATLDRNATNLIVKFGDALFSLLWSAVVLCYG